EVVLFRQQRQYLFREMILTHSKDATAFPVYALDCGMHYQAILVFLVMSFLPGNMPSDALFKYSVT
ncbi:MAG: hypothetical protein QG591_2071, partial [Planctomycetota bacterium]|nr:hypothetical protein [Planctomycetota bacterium]